MNLDVYRNRDIPNKRWMDYVKDDVGKNEVSTELTADRQEWKKKMMMPDEL